mmetsp:Transcript_24953/g.52465  ORF Transcript_24953/g.52465 Transcript_24953/m.52465 type:complete len:352 (+) Transcript_24953:190-1245(+)|eukprot:CAMPEP_0171336834 /NCGR_PEP_ID=MMETSP0878-20121228/6288_1 /TAXON_ID=67004 /ORGANISM="Thalassiosira weissflogii, Strain CCMP1336" /LENGTH=351 /DNA_ID=CAMNT_0011838367 /DNA_START=117 /DNA_END=1172 /DNA_ORIENTATION=+
MSPPSIPSKSSYPKEIIDPHHHFLDSANNPFQSFFRSQAGDVTYLPEHYVADVIRPLADLGIHFRGSVHVEAMPDDGADELDWVEGMIETGRCSYVKGFVASCDLTLETAEEEMERLRRASPARLRGVRWILNCVGKYRGGTTATHVGTLRHDGVDYLREPDFERGLASLEKQNLSFDLQCAPIQLVQSAAALFAKYPNLKVCIDHMGTPRAILGNDLLDDGSGINPNDIPDEDELKAWREGMTAMAALPNAYVKLSMLGYAVPGWMRTPERQSVVKSLVRETVELFGAGRCMVAWNWHVNAAVSDADSHSQVGPDAIELLDMMLWFFDGYSDEEKERLFSGTAKEFYRLD